MKFRSTIGYFRKSFGLAGAFLFRRALALGLTIFALAGCASWVAEILPIGQPVTAERCRALNMSEFGLKDGREGRRQGDRYDFWVQDCKAFGVKLDRSLYDEGFKEGIAEYCSCEKGFTAGVKSEFAELRGQYYICSKSDYGDFLRGHQAGSDYNEDSRFMKRISEVKVEYNDEAISAKAAEMCPRIPGNGSSGPVRDYRAF